LLSRTLARLTALNIGSAAVLMAAAVLALLWANLDAGSYEWPWSQLVLGWDVRHIVNDLLMALFFFVVALEVKRERRFGSLRDTRAAAVPIAAAFGTMVGAALTYVAVNLIADGDLRGWAIPIATDIAFAVGALGVVGRRAPAQLRTFLLTLAVVDDLATIVVIALFFGESIDPLWVAAAVAAAGAVALVPRRLWLYLPLAGALWYALYKAGVHPTIAGVVLGFLTPAAVLERREHRFAPWSAYVVLPVFALANAGVPVSLAGLGDALTGPVGLGIALGLALGAPLAGVAVSYSLVRFTPARLQQGLDWPAISALAPLKGIGFTVAIFISVLAFDGDQALQDEAKLAILSASLLSGIIGVTALALLGRRSAVREPLGVVAEQPEHGRPQADEQGAPLGVPALLLGDGLRADPQRDAEDDPAERGAVENRSDQTHEERGTPASPG